MRTLVLLVVLLNQNVKKVCRWAAQAPREGVVVAGTSAARLHTIGDLWAERPEFVAPRRRQSQRSDVRYRRRSLDVPDVTVVGGLPMMMIDLKAMDVHLHSEW